jgi:hypothetical protein
MLSLMPYTFVVMEGGLESGVFVLLEILMIRKSMR